MPAGWSAIPRAGPFEEQGTMPSSVPLVGGREKPFALDYAAGPTVLDVGAPLRVAVDLRRAAVL